MPNHGICPDSVGKLQPKISPENRVTTWAEADWRYRSVWFFSENVTRRLLKYCTYLGCVENKENAHVRKSTQDNGMKGSVAAHRSGFKSQL